MESAGERLRGNGQRRVSPQLRQGETDPWAGWSRAAVEREKVPPRHRPGGGGKRSCRGGRGLDGGRVCGAAAAGGGVGGPAPPPLFESSSGLSVRSDFQIPDRRISRLTSAVAVKDGEELFHGLPFVRAAAVVVAQLVEGRKARAA